MNIVPLLSCNKNSRVNFHAEKVPLNQKFGSVFGATLPFAALSPEVETVLEKTIQERQFYEIALRLSIVQNETIRRSSQQPNYNFKCHLL